MLSTIRQMYNTFINFMNIHETPELIFKTFVPGKINLISKYAFSPEVLADSDKVV